MLLLTWQYYMSKVNLLIVFRFLNYFISLFEFEMNLKLTKKKIIVTISHIPAYMDSDSEESDSDLSDVPEVDSDLEAEKQITYDRAVYKEDMDTLKKKQKQDTQHGAKRSAAPSQGLKLEYVHG